MRLGVILTAAAFPLASEAPVLAHRITASVPRPSSTQCAYSQSLAIKLVFNFFTNYTLSFLSKIQCPRVTQKLNANTKTFNFQDSEPSTIAIVKSQSLIIKSDFNLLSHNQVL
ncbi:unnamed protein product [Colias eurytheme]|nr:unnamed protein product [Colias eurytheme]